MPKKLTPFVDRVQQVRLADAGRSKKERRTAKVLSTQRLAAGCDGGYTRLTEYIRDKAAWSSAGSTSDCNWRT